MSGNKILDRPILPFKARKAVFEKLEDIADVASMSPEDRERYDNSVKVYRDYLVTMDAAEQKGMKEGSPKSPTTNSAEHESQRDRQPIYCRMY